MAQQIRLNKYIASAGIASRRGADELIEEGKVKVNGQPVTEPGMSVTSKDKVEVNGKKIVLQQKKYAIFYKPAGYITTRKDIKDRKTIYDLLPKEMYDLKPAGRLDKDSTGLLILTNDGDLIQKLTHPKGIVPKVYKVTVEGKISHQDLDRMKKGIELEKGKTAYADAVVLECSNQTTTLEMTLYQGYYRQIRRMLKILNHSVTALKRVSHANIVLFGLDRGKYRYLSGKEVDELYNYLKNLEKKNHNTLKK
jgi:23S rRNA pseudouridine2605 synthase